MDTAPSGTCQTGSLPVRLIVRAVVGMLLATTAVLGLSPAKAQSDHPSIPAEASPSPAPTPPEWQRDLAALTLLRAASALNPGISAADGKTPSEHLAEGYRKVAAKYPEQPEVQKASGDFFYDAALPTEAFRCWQRAQVLDPKDGQVSAAMGEVYLQSGDARNAAAQFQRAVDAQPDEPQFHTELANVLYLFRKELVNPPARPDAEAVLVQALEQFRLASQLAPTNRETAQAYAETFDAMAKPDWTAGIKAWQKVLTLSGENTDFSNLQIARAFLRLQQPLDAEKHLDRLRRPDFMPLQTKLRERAKKMEETERNGTSANPP